MEPLRKTASPSDQSSAETTPAIATALPGSAVRIVSAVLATALALVGCLSACASQSPATSSASRIAFEAAFDTDYEIARDAVAQRAEDAKLLAVSSTDFSQAHFAPGWSFLFYSWQRASAYTVFVADGQATIADNPGLSVSQDDFDAIPKPTSIVWDADAAYGSVIEQLDGQGEYLTCRAYLTFASSDGDGKGQNTFEWVFSLNEEQDLRSIYLDPDAEIAPATTFSVDASDGQAERKA